MTPWESSSGSNCSRCSNGLRVSIARDEYLDSQPQAVRGFLRAYVESVRYYKRHRAEAVKKIIALSKLHDPKWASAVYDNSLRSTPDDGKPTLKGMEVVLNAAAKENPKAKAITVQQLVDLRYFQ
ncbi:MAG: hypothetical protein ACXW6V_24965 [Candidatus Binatia bacterium]